MTDRSPALKDLFTVLYRPRETMRRVLDGSRDRWAIQIIVLAFVCASVGDSDLRNLRNVFPGLQLAALLAFVAVCIVLIAVFWAGFVFAFAWLVAFVGRLLKAEAPVADVRAALAWGLVPIIWSVVYRIPLSVYLSRFPPQATNNVHFVSEFIEKGGCGVAILVGTVQLLFEAWVVFVASCCVAEAFRISSWKGLGVLAVSAAIPLAVFIAAVMVLKT